MQPKNLLIVVFSLFTLLNLTDAFTSYFVLTGEGNIIYLFTGSYIILLLVKIVINFLVWKVLFYNKFKTPTAYYMFLFIIIMGIITMLIGTIANTVGIMQPAVIEAASKGTVAQKANAYVWFQILVSVMPMLISTLVFWIHEHTREFTLLKKTFPTPYLDAAVLESRKKRLYEEVRSKKRRAKMRYK